MAKRKSYVEESEDLSPDVQVSVGELEAKKQDLIVREKSQDQIDAIDIQIRNLKGIPEDRKGRDKNHHPAEQLEIEQ